MASASLGKKRINRRASLGFSSTPKLERRVILKEIFEKIDVTKSGRISLDDFKVALDKSSEIRSFFSGRAADSTTLFQK